MDAPDHVGPARLRALRLANAILALVHLGQALVILALASDFSLPVTGAFLAAQPGSPIPPQETLFEVPIGPMVAAFLLLAAVDHAVVCAPGVHRRYERRLLAGEGPARWIEYAFSASIMVGLIAMLTGVADIGALLGVVGVNAAMILFGWLMERANADRADAVDWLPFVFGCIAGAVPWAIITVAIAGSVADGAGPPGFVYGIFASLLVLFFSFAVNQGLQFARIGPWARPLHAEWGYLALSLVAKTLLAWQVFANTLVL